jgi:serine/threonine-protein kinase RsbW
MGQGPLSLELEIPSDIGYIEDVVAEVVRRCEAAAFPGRHVAFHIPVALTEALSNAILRGNAEDTSKSVRVRVMLDAHALVLEVEDDGVGFDLEACTLDPTTSDNLMDQVEQFRARGNVVRMTLRRRSSDDRAA